MKTLTWMGSSKKDLIAMPIEIRSTFGHGLRLAQDGDRHVSAKPYSGSVELIEDFDGDTYRCVYNTKIDDDIYVLHVFQKKSTSGISVPKHIQETIDLRLRDAKLLAAAKKKANNTNPSGSPQPTTTRKVKKGK